MALRWSEHDLVHLEGRCFERGVERAARASARLGFSSDCPHVGLRRPNSNRCSSGPGELATRLGLRGIVPTWGCVDRAPRSVVNREVGDVALPHVRGRHRSILERVRTRTGHESVKPPPSSSLDPRARLRARNDAPQDARGRARSTAVPFSSFRSRARYPAPVRGLLLVTPIVLAGAMHCARGRRSKNARVR
jgi:hypothetical protein